MSTHDEQSGNESETSREEDLPVVAKPVLKRQKKVELNSEGQVIKKPRTEKQQAAFEKCRKGLEEWKLLKQQEKAEAKATASTMLETAINSDGKVIVAAPAETPVKKTRKKKVKAVDPESVVQKKTEEPVDWKQITMALASNLVREHRATHDDLDDDDVPERPVKHKRRVVEEEEESEEETQPKKRRKPQVYEAERFQRMRPESSIHWL